jgi:hypothetical protein
MATGLAPGFRYSGQAKHRLSYQQVKRLAQAYGLPGDAIAQIAKGESGMYADVQQRDPGDGNVGYGLLQMTPNAWGAAAKQRLAQLGGIQAMRDPAKNMAMARYLYKSAGNKLSPWYGTRFLTNRSGEGKLGPVNRSLIGSLGGSSGGGGSTSSGGTTTTTTGQPDFGAQPSALPLIEALTQSQQQAPASASIQAPDFAAHPVMPAGFGTVSGGSGPAPRPDIGALAAAVKTLGGSVPAAGMQTSTDTPATDQPTADVSGNYPGMRGAVKFSPNADRPGVKTQQITRDFLERVAGFSHRTLSVGTGTNHNQMTKIGDLTAAHALEAAGVPWSQAIRMAQKGGVFNITPKKGQFKGHRVQVLWKTMVGGNHHNHVHVGIR